ncbi:MAG: exosortase C-terminal domain/associated protein EpsI [Anaerolineaceae bacterium]
MTLNRTFLASALMLLSAIATIYLTHGHSKALITPLCTFPMQIGEWTGKQNRFDERVYDSLGADDTLLGIYTNHDGRQIEIFLSFYNSQREGRQIHSPRNCMPGAGWTITESSREEVGNPHGSPSRLSFTKLIMEKANEKMIMLYCYRSGGKYVASEYAFKLNLVLDSIFRQRSDGMFIRLTCMLKSDDATTEFRYMQGFTELLIPLIEEYVQK